MRSAILNCGAKRSVPLDVTPRCRRKALVQNCEISRNPKRNSSASTSSVRTTGHIFAFFALTMTMSASCASDSDTSAAPLKCRPVLARQFDATQKCYLPAAALPELTFCQSANSHSTGSGEFTCIVNPSGVAYSTWKEFTECLTPGASGWAQYARESPCTQNIPSDDSVCNRMVGGTTGNPPAELPGPSCADQ